MQTEALARVRETVGRFTHRTVDTFVEPGIDYAAIVQRAEAWHADLIILGSHGQSGLARAVGHVAERVARYAHCDTLVARAGTKRGWVLAATDLSGGSLPAIAAGADEARRRGARLEVVHAVGFLEKQMGYLFELATPGVSPSAYDVELPRRLLAEALARVSVDAPATIVDRPAASAIVQEAEALGAELIVVGTRGRTGLVRLMLGGVAERVLHAAHCSVRMTRRADA
jgi:nucleotide-binding universal stress UspA family protein